MLARVGDNGFPILHPSTCLYNLPLKLNTVPLVTLSRRHLKIAREAIWGSLCCLYIWSKMWLMVSSKGLSVNREVTSYETTISSSPIVRSFNFSAKSNVFLMVCWFSASGAKYLERALAVS